MSEFKAPQIKIPVSFQHHFDTGCRLLREGKEDEAEAFFLKAASVYPEAWLGIACQHMAAGMVDEAMKRMAQVYDVATKPMLKGIAANNLGTMLSDKGHSSDARKYFLQSFALWRNADSLSNLALIEKHNGNIRAAKKLISKSLMIDPNQPQTRFTKSLIDLLLGDFENGFRDYESRWANPKTGLTKLPIFRPEWAGEPIEGKRILVYAEQGAGDTIQMLRYLPMIRDRGATVLIAPQKGLGSVCRRMCFDLIYEDILQRIEKGNVPEFDVLVPSMSLPRIFGTEVNSVPLPVSFPTTKQQMPTDRLNVGIVWAGSSAHSHDKWRSTKLSDWSRLWSLPVNFHSLQVGPRSIDIMAEDAPVSDVTSTFTDYASTADFVSSLDLVIGVDTSVIHLAGTLGVKTWLINAFSPDWRWMLHRSDSPWYPSVTQFRQVQPMDWRWVFDDVKRELSKLCFSHHNRN